MTLKGVAEWTAALTSMTVAVDRAVQRGVSQGAYAVKLAIQENIGGPPRWVGHEHHPRTGGPGEITGRLKKGVGYKRPVPRGRGVYVTRISAKRIYSAKTERKYPYFQPGVRRSIPVVQRIIDDNVRAALRR